MPAAMLSSGGDQASIMHILRFRPASSLRSFVDCYWCAALPARDGGNGHVRLLPFLPSPGGLEIFIQLDTPFELDGAKAPLAHVACWRTRAAPVGARAGTRLFAIRVRAGMGPHLAAPPIPALADRFTDVADIWGPAGARFAADVREARHDRERIAITDNFLISRLRPQRGRAIAWAVRQLEQGQATIESLADASSLGLRQFEARFLAATGNSPARFRRLARLRRNIKVLAREDGVLVDLVDEAYFDQAQQIREFKTFTGLTPGAMRAQLRSACHFYDLARRAELVTFPM
jgi:AraC-like DNA-binding protein